MRPILKNILRKAFQKQTDAGKSFQWHKEIQDHMTWSGIPRGGVEVGYP
jgi:predicted phosphoribosyltransferase